MATTQPDEKDVSLPSLFLELIMQCKNCSNEGKQRELAIPVLNILDAEEQNPVTYKFLVAKKNDDSSSLIVDLLRALQGCDENLAYVAICRCLNGYSTRTTANLRTKRLKNLVKLDATNCLMKALRDLLKNDQQKRNEQWREAVNCVASILLLLAPIDRRFTLKARLGGLLPLFSYLFSEQESLFNLISLLARFVRSRRNAQLFGKQEDFAVNLVAALGDSISSAEHKLRLAEILYFVSRNAKARAKLVQQGVIAALIALFQRNYNGCFTDNVQLELCLVSTACLRQLAKFKSGKEELTKAGILDLCEKTMQMTRGESEVENERMDRLVHSLCALCMRCLPARQLRPAIDDFAMRWPLPQRSMHRDREMSSDEDDDDEDDDVIVSGEDGQVKSDEEDVDQQIQYQAVSEITRNYSKRKVNELKSRYRKYVKEFKEGEKQSSKERASSSPKEKQFSQRMAQMSLNSNCVAPFLKIAFPEWNDPEIELPLQPISRYPDAIRETVVKELARSRNEQDFTERIVYDLDKLLTVSPDIKKPLQNDDMLKIGIMDSNVEHLIFESRFECGNLRRVTQVGPTNYELLLSPDINQVRPHYQWFYFHVSNNEQNVAYTFEIINCLKTHSMFSNGMQPLVYSVSEAVAGRRGWVRAGHSVCYYRNLYAQEKRTKKNAGYFSVKFHITFRHRADICYLAYHYPYSFTYLQTKLSGIFVDSCSADVYTRRERLCMSLGGNRVDILTVTAPGNRDELANRDLIVLTGRIHPGESNASWMMHGAIEFLLGNDSKAVECRRRFIFKIVPMLNPDGVINGSHRCSLAGQDLNRQWHSPSPVFHPTVYHTKGLIQYLIDIEKKKPMVFVDMHGHSRRNNVFMFGNNPEESWHLADVETMQRDGRYLLLPQLLDREAPAFSLANCRFSICKAKEPSARVVLWRQFGIDMAYTMEATYCGFDSGPYRGFQVGLSQLREMGRVLCQAFLSLPQCTHTANSSADSGSSLSEN